MKNIDTLSTINPLAIDLENLKVRGQSTNDGHFTECVIITRGGNIDVTKNVNAAADRLATDMPFFYGEIAGKELPNPAAYVRLLVKSYPGCFDLDLTGSRNQWQVIDYQRPLTNELKRIALKTGLDDGFVELDIPTAEDWAQLGGMGVYLAKIFEYFFEKKALFINNLRFKYFSFAWAPTVKVVDLSKPLDVSTLNPQFTYIFVTSGKVNPFSLNDAMKMFGGDDSVTVRVADNKIRMESGNGKKCYGRFGVNPNDYWQMFEY